MKIISISQTFAVWQVDKNQKIGKFSSFFEPNFASQKSHHRISKIPTAQIYFSRRFKICNLILPSLLGNGRSNMYFQRFWKFFLRFSQSLNPLTEGGWVNSKSHLSHDWSTSLWNTSEKKVGKFTAKQKKMILSSPRVKKAILALFRHIWATQGR